MLKAEDDSPRDPQRKATNPKLMWLARMALGLVVVGILVRWQGASIGPVLKNTSPITVFAAVVFYLASQMISAFKWQLLLNAATRAWSTPGETPSTPEPASLNPPLSFWECYCFYLIGMFCNLWLPTSIGGDVFRAGLAGKRCGSVALAASSIFLERLTGFCALVTIGMFGLLAFFGNFANTNADANAGKSRAVAIAIIALLLIAAIIISLWAARRAAHRFSTRSEDSLKNSPAVHKFLEFHRVIDAYLLPATRTNLVSALTLSFAFQSSQIALNVFLAHAVALKLPIGVFTWLVPSLGIASMLPLGIGGLGVREAGALALLNGALSNATVIEPGKIIAWSLLWQATLWLSGLPGALAYFASTEKLSDSQLETLNPKP